MKAIKFIQINIYKGKYVESLIKFLKAENPDFISMQEVTTNGFNFYKNKTVNLFELLKERLLMYGVYHGDVKLSDIEDSFFGNAVFSKYKIVESGVSVLKTFRPVTLDELDGENAVEIRPKVPRHLLNAKINFLNRRINVLSWHGAWTAPPVDTKETLRQAKIVADYLVSLKEPFILGTDLNNTIDSKTVGLINNIANNLMINSKIKQTTHPVLHRIAPRGFLIDYIFTSVDFTLKSLQVPQVLVSDHLPVVAIVEI